MNSPLKRANSWITECEEFILSDWSPPDNLIQSERANSWITECEEFILPDWSPPHDPARVLAAEGRLNPSLSNCQWVKIWIPFHLVKFLQLQNPPLDECERDDDGPHDGDISMSLMRIFMLPTCKSSWYPSPNIQSLLHKYCLKSSPPPVRHFCAAHGCYQWVKCKWQKQRQM